MFLLLVIIGLPLLAGTLVVVFLTIQKRKAIPDMEVPIAPAPQGPPPTDPLP